jgi:hypothetical protein
MMKDALCPPCALAGSKDTVPADESGGRDHAKRIENPQYPVPPEGAARSPTRQHTAANICDSRSYAFRLTAATSKITYRRPLIQQERAGRFVLPPSLTFRCHACGIDA